MSTVRCCRYFLKPMLERNSGKILIVSSEAGLRPIADMIPYSMTKAAQINIARGLAELTKGTRVTVNSLLPGPTLTEGVSSFVDDLVEKGLGTDKEDAMSKYFSSREPTSLLQRFLSVEEVANVATFLCSDLSSGINGSAQLVEGGIIRHI
jgi:NAD(P)-dependent dehydrogenase (short-subunit alcohol dehydrogenase family)